MGTKHYGKTATVELKPTTQMTWKNFTILGIFWVIMQEIRKKQKNFTFKFKIVEYVFLVGSLHF